MGGKNSGAVRWSPEFMIRCRGEGVAFPQALGVINGTPSTRRRAASTRGEGRGRAHSPFVGVRSRMKFFIECVGRIIQVVRSLATLDVIVIPAILLARLQAREELGPSDEECNSGVCEFGNQC